MSIKFTNTVKDDTETKIAITSTDHGVKIQIGDGKKKATFEINDVNDIDTFSKALVMLGMIDEGAKFKMVVAGKLTL